MDIQEIGLADVIVNSAVISPGIVSAGRLTVKVLVGNSRVDNFIDSYALHVVKDGSQGFHVILMGMSDEPKVDMASGLHQMFP